MTGTWKLLGVWGVWEYWTPDTHHGGVPAIDAQVYRRKIYREGLGLDSTGKPMGVRWESTFAHFQRYVAGTLAF